MSTPEPSQQIEPRDELLSIAASADELAERIRRGESADIGSLVGAIVRERDAEDDEPLAEAA